MAKKELDRFAKNYKKDIKIHTKLMAILIGSVVFVCALVATLSLIIFENKEVEIERNNTLANSVGVIRIVDDWKLQIDFYSYLFSINRDLEIALANNDNAALTAVTKEVIGNLDLDFWAVTDTKGNILKSEDLTGSIAGSPYVTKALKGQSSWGYDTIGNQAYAIISAYPVRYEGKVVGTVVF